MMSGTDSAGRQHQMCQRVQFADNDFGGLSRRRSGHEPMPVAAAKTLTRPTVFDG